MASAVDGAPGEQLERVDPIAGLSAPTLYENADARKLAAFKQKCRGLNDVEVALALEMIGSLGLNPWANEVYAAKGNQGLLIMVGRDGLLRKAEEFPDYAGYDCGVVYEGDVFEKGEPDSDGKTLRQRAGVKHSQGVPERDAQIKGAWAVAERRGRPPRFFFARFDEYLPNMDADKLAKTPWGKQPSVMIEKVPISVVHRTLCNLSGVYLPEEVESTLNTDGNRPISRESEQAALADLVDGLDASAETKDGLVSAMAEMNALYPGSWTLAKAQMALTAKTDEELRKTLAGIHADIAAEAERKAAEVQEEDIQDAEVVAEPTEEAAKLQARRDGLVQNLTESEVGTDAYLELSAELDAVESRLEELGS